MPHRITQCYLPPGSGDFLAFTPADLYSIYRPWKDARLSWPKWWLYPKIVYLPKMVTYLRNNQVVSWLGIKRITKIYKSNVLVTTPPRHYEISMHLVSLYECCQFCENLILPEFFRKYQLHPGQHHLPFHFNLPCLFLYDQIGSLRKNSYTSIVKDIWRLL